MGIVFLFFAAGILLGFVLRRFENISFLSKVISGVIFLLLFLLGKSVGRNEAIMQNLPTIGLQAVIIATAAITGSVLMSMLVYKKFFAGNKEVLKFDTIRLKLKSKKAA